VPIYLMTDQPETTSSRKPARGKARRIGNDNHARLPSVEFFGSIEFRETLHGFSKVRPQQIIARLRQIHQWLIGISSSIFGAICQEIGGIDQILLSCSMIRSLCSK